MASDPTNMLFGPILARIFSIPADADIIQWICQYLLFKYRSLLGNGIFKTMIRGRMDT